MKLIVYMLVMASLVLQACSVEDSKKVSTDNEAQMEWQEYYEDSNNSVLKKTSLSEVINKCEKLKMDSCKVGDSIILTSEKPLSIKTGNYSLREIDDNDSLKKAYLNEITANCKKLKLDSCKTGDSTILTIMELPDEEDNNSVKEKEK